MSMLAPKISDSIVIHQQAVMVNALLEDLSRLSRIRPLEVVLTLSLPEAHAFRMEDFAFPVFLQNNAAPKGLSANHNYAYPFATGDFFCVIHPDIDPQSDLFPSLLAALADSVESVVAPLELSPDDRVEESAWRFCTPFKIGCRALGGRQGNDDAIWEQPLLPDWVGGIFQLFPRAVFAQLCGFDPRYFLYNEDVDRCARLPLLGYQVMLSSHSKVLHHAQRSFWGQPRTSGPSSCVAMSSTTCLRPDSSSYASGR